jgi:hypothetical protein
LVFGRASFTSVVEVDRLIECPWCERTCVAISGTLVASAISTDDQR